MADLTDIAKYHARHLERLARVVINLSGTPSSTTLGELQRASVAGAGEAARMTGASHAPTNRPTICTSGE
jgi:hypothetical protein